MASHYQTVVVPTRVARTKDKAAVENHVKHLTTHIIGRMRNYQCFSIDEYNQYLLKILNEFNAKPFQKKVGTRLQMFRSWNKKHSKHYHLTHMNSVNLKKRKSIRIVTSHSINTTILCLSNILVNK